jgi:hypothetical protein
MVAQWDIEWDDQAAYLHPAGSVPAEDAYRAIHSGLVAPNAALLPVQVVHQSVVEYITCIEDQKHIEAKYTMNLPG